RIYHVERHIIGIMSRIKRNHIKSGQYNYYFWTLLGIFTFLLAACLRSAGAIPQVAATRTLPTQTPTPARSTPLLALPPALPTAGPVLSDVDEGDWPAYLLSNGSGFNGRDTTINVKTAANLQPYWT